MSDEQQYAEGGYVGYVGGSGEPWAVIHPNECLLNRDLRCIRSDHPTDTSACRKRP